MTDESIPQLPSRRARREAERAAQRGWFGGLSNTGSLPVITQAEPSAPTSDDDSTNTITDSSDSVVESQAEQPDAPVIAPTPTFMPRRERRLLMESGVLPTLPKPTVEPPVFDHAVPSFMADAIQESTPVAHDHAEPDVAAESTPDLPVNSSDSSVASLEDEAPEIVADGTHDEQLESGETSAEDPVDDSAADTPVTHVVPPVTRPEPIEISSDDEVLEDDQQASDVEPVDKIGAEATDVIDGGEVDIDAESSDEIVDAEGDSDDEDEPDIALDAVIETDPVIEEELDEDDIDRWLGEADQDAVNAPVTWSLGLPVDVTPAEHVPVVEFDVELDVELEPEILAEPGTDHDSEIDAEIDAEVADNPETDKPEESDSETKDVEEVAAEALEAAAEAEDDEDVSGVDHEADYEPAEIPAVQLDTAPIAHVEQDEYEFRVIPQHPIDDHEYELVPVEHDLPEVEVPDPNPEGLSPASIPNIANLTAPIDLPIEGGWREQVYEENDDDIAPSQGIGYSNAGVSANTLTLPEIPTQDLSVPLNATGEILLTGPIMTINQTFDTAPLFVDEAQPTIESTPEVQMAPRRAQEALVLIGRPAEEDDKKTVPTTNSAVYAGVAAFLGLIVITVGALALFTDIL